MSAQSVQASREEEIRSLVEQGRIWEARTALATAGDSVPADSLLRPLLAPPVIKTSAITGVDRSLEFAWLTSNGAQYHGKWVALLGEELVAHADSLKVLLGQIRALPLAAEPLLHHLA
jgi:hypothetical protein